MKLGELEKKVMDYIWTTCPDCTFTVRQIVDGVNDSPSCDYAYNTILTVMTHLHEKNLLKRAKEGKTFNYTIGLSRDEFVRRASKAVFDQMKQDYGELAIAHFANLIDDVDPILLKRAQDELAS